MDLHPGTYTYTDKYLHRPANHSTHLPPTQHHLHITCINTSKYGLLWPIVRQCAKALYYTCAAGKLSGEIAATTNSFLIYNGSVYFVVFSASFIYAFKSFQFSAENGE